MTKGRNPWAKKVQTKKENPFSARLKKGLRSTPKQYAWIKTGMKLRVCWYVDPAYGSASYADFTGRVVLCDDWITLVSPLKIKLHMPLSMATKIEQL